MNNANLRAELTAMGAWYSLAERAALFARYGLTLSRND